MLTRRRALSVLAAAGIGTVTFRRALAATASASDAITSEMITNAEWVAGIKLNDEQRKMASEILSENRKYTEIFRDITLDNSLLPPFVFTPFASPAARPDPRGYQVSKSSAPAIKNVKRPETDDELAFASLRTIGALLRARKVSSAELTKLYLERLHKYDPLLKCVVTFTDELALKQAEQADRELTKGHDRGPLHGIPWGMKDVLAYPGYPTTWGAPQYRKRTIDTKAAVAERLEQAGAVLVAKLATGPFAGENFWYRGRTRNPWNPHQDASGSSSGSASATAAGLVGFSIATETGGSLIGPAARCGATGLRPSYGRVSRHGCMQLCWSLDKIGPICRSVDDCGLVFAAIHGSDPRDNASVDRPYVWPGSRKLSTLRVGYMEDDPHVDHEADLGVLRELGVQLVPTKMPPLLKEFNLPFGMLEAIVTIESSATFEDLTRHGEPKGVKLWPPVWAYGPFFTGIDYLKYSRIRGLIMQQIDKNMQTVDIYFGDDGRTLTNMTGHPKVVFPKQFKDVDGFHLPRPQMMIGRLYDESTLLTLADAYQRELGLDERPALDKFLADKDKFLAGEVFPDESKLYEE